jgi:hypothetical protein
VWFLFPGTFHKASFFAQFVMLVNLEIPPTPLPPSSKKFGDSLVNIVVLLHSVDPCHLEFGTIFLDNPTDFPPLPTLTETLSETLDDLPSSLPSIRRHASDGMATFTPETKKEKVIEFATQTPLKIINSISIFSLQFPSLVFDGYHHFEGVFIDPSSHEKIRFSLQLPHGFHDGLGHIALGSLHPLSQLPSIPVYFSDLILSLNYLWGTLPIQRIPFPHKAWMGSAIVNFIWTQISTRHEAPGPLLTELFQVLSSLLHFKQFRHGDFAIVLLGQLLETCSSSDFHLGKDCDALYSAPLKLFYSGLEIFQIPSKKETIQSTISGMDSPSFATFRSIRIALNFLLNQDLNSQTPSYQACRVVIPLLLRYQQLATQSTAKQIFRYGSRDCWGFLEHLHAYEESVTLFQQTSSTFFQGNVVLSNFLQTKELLENDSARDGESQILAHLISSLATIAEAQRELLLESPHLQSHLNSNESIAEYLQTNLIPSFDDSIRCRQDMQVAVDKYLHILRKIQQTDSTHVPSFRRLWSYQEFKSLNRKYEQLLEPSPDEDGLESKFDQTEPSSKPLIFVTPWAGTGAKGQPVTSSRTLLSAMTFNNPSCLAVRTDRDGNPCYSGGIDEQSGHVYVSDMLNHSIRVLVKPRLGYSLIGDATGSSGSSVGATSKSSIHSPRGLCTHTLIDGSFEKTLLIICDSMNNALKGVVVDKVQMDASQSSKARIIFPEHEVFSILSNSLANPTGVCSLDGSLYVCCRGDHTVRLISLQKKVSSFSFDSILIDAGLDHESTCWGSGSEWICGWAHGFLKTLKSCQLHGCKWLCLFY